MSLPIQRITASSHYQSAKYGTDGLGPEQVLLEAPRFGGWLSALNEWQDSWLLFEFLRESWPTRLTLQNGFIEPEKAKERDDYYYHLRARQIELCNGYETIRLELSDSKDKQTHAIAFTIPSTRIQLTVRSVWRDSPDGVIRSHEVVGFGPIRWDE